MKTGRETEIKYIKMCYVTLSYLIKSIDATQNTSAMKFGPKYFV